jgi:hypothetical protein
MCTRRSNPPKSLQEKDMQKLPELTPAVTDFVVSQGNSNQKLEKFSVKVSEQVMGVSCEE